MGEEPSEIREEIEQTRAEMGDTVEALGQKADVKGRAKDSISDKVESVRSKVTGATDAAPDAEQVKQGARRAAGVAQENPLGLAIGSVAVGFLFGLAAPSTRVEDERIGPVADDVKAKAKETGQEAVERGKEVAQQAAESAKETAQEAGREQAEEMRSGSSETEGNGQPSPAGSPAA
jgi:ElaB/YqjD/DUF883 family membrane-anchored ribosome-binding protein